MTTDHDLVPQEGRPIELTPVAPGVWLTILGSGVMVLGPLFGFLVGTMIGADGHVLGTSPMFFFLFLGFVVAGVGLGITLIGVRRILQRRLTAAPEQPADQR
jgi:protein-S-isoprenylcysteine O-methyltransferase Ste14